MAALMLSPAAAPLRCLPRRSPGAHATSTAARATVAVPVPSASARAAPLGALRRRAALPSSGAAAQGLRGLGGASLAPSARALRPLRRQGTVRVAAAAETAAAPSAPEPASTFGLLANIYGAVRAIGFYLTTTIIAVPLFCVMLLCWGPVLLLDKYKRGAMHLVNNVWANLTTLFWYPIEVKGMENLPDKDTPVVYVANHQSFLDIFSLFRLWRPFKFVSKTSIFMIPIIGWSMFLTGHIGIKRTDRRSQMACLNDCRKMLQEGASVLFFPEGTRSNTGEMIAFKKGAFTVAAKEKKPVVPITIVGAGQLLANGKEGFLRGGKKVTMVVHPTLYSDDADELMRVSEKLIKDELVKYDYKVRR